MKVEFSTRLNFRHAGGVRWEPCIQLRAGDLKETIFMRFSLCSVTWCLGSLPSPVVFWLYWEGFCWWLVVPSLPLGFLSYFPKGLTCRIILSVLLSVSSFSLPPSSRL